MKHQQSNFWLTFYKCWSSLLGAAIWAPRHIGVCHLGTRTFGHYFDKCIISATNTTAVISPYLIFLNVLFNIGHVDSMVAIGNGLISLIVNYFIDYLIIITNPY